MSIGGRNFLQGALLVLLGASLLWGQMTTGTISGVASDQTGAVVTGVAVTVRNVDTGIARSVSTNERGRYVAPQLNPGNYEVEAALAGFQTLRRRGIVLTVGSEQVVDLELGVGATAETIEVTGELPVVDTTTATVSGLVDERSIRALPLNARSFDHLALLEVAVARYDFQPNNGSRGRGQAMAVAGSKPIQNSYLFDGIEIMQHGSGSIGSILGTNLGVEGIREFQVLTSNFQAEYGRVVGGILNAVTRAGTNEFHGSVYEYLRNSVLDAKDFFDRPDPAPIPPFKRNQFGFSLGGPIQKDRMFFFGNYEGLRARKGLTYNAVVPSNDARDGQLPDGPVTIAEGIKPYLALYPRQNTTGVLASGGAIYHHTPTQKVRQDYLAVRLDAQLSDRHFLFGRYLLEDALGDTPKGDSVFTALFTSRRQQAVLGVDSMLTPTTLNVFRAGFTRNYEVEDDQPIASLDAGLAFEKGKDILGKTSVLGSVEVTGFTPLGTFFLIPRYYVLNAFEYSDTLNYSRGAHAFKFGANLKRWQDNAINSSTERGRYQFPSMRGFLEGKPDAYSHLLLQGYPFGWRQWIPAFFAQDTYRVRPNLTLNLGLRWEFSTDPAEVNGRIANYPKLMESPETEVGLGHFLSKKTLDPRFGFAWTPTASRKTAIRGGFGIYHEVFTPIYTIYLVKPPFHITETVRNAGFPNPYAGGTVQVDPPGFRGSPLRPNSPSKMSITLNVQQEILPDTSLTAGYVGSLSRHTVLTRNINERTPSKDANGITFYPANAPIRFPALGGAVLIAQCCSSHYHSMVVALRRQPRGRFGYQLSYTWAQDIDYASAGVLAESSNSSNAVMDPDDYARDRARSSWNLKHSLVTNYTLDLPSTNFGGVAGSILNGWGMQGILTASSGAPTNIEAGFNRSRSFRAVTGGQDRPDLVAGFSNNPVKGVTAGCKGVEPGQKLGDPALYFDPCAFALPTAGYFGNLGRNTVIGPGTFNFDFSVAKNFAFTERTNLEFKSAFFNLFNTPNFEFPGSRVFTTSGALQPTAGKILHTKGSSRQIQFSLKLTF